MEKIGLNELRSMFLNFYKARDHYQQNSFSLVPQNDKSLLIINSGMAPLKAYFSGAATPPGKRMTTCQKCIRTGDIDNVGLTARHGTFFEMLGSFSFGDYFKKESLKWGWEFIIDVLKMPEDKLWATIYEEDDEAWDIWKNEIGLPEERIVRLGKEDNFWEIGIGPCGPCSEIYFDRGEAYACSNPDCKPGCDCDRYVEFWNHVFTQFNRDSEGNYSPLKQKNIDTGMGLERLACIMQGVDSIFDVDTIHKILEGVQARSGVLYQEGKVKTDVSIRIITDHIRSITFMISDGILPSNEGRGYVLRRLLRRAARHGKLLGIGGSFLPQLAEIVINVSKDAYPELAEKEEYIKHILSIEEEKFSVTIDQGSVLLAEQMELMAGKGERILSGDTVFRLYDTFGFPLELTREILSEQGYEADIEGFNLHMANQKESARAARKTDTDEGWKGTVALPENLTPTIFTGYDTREGRCAITGIYRDGVTLESMNEGETGLITLDRTPFYAEGGGQVSDTGQLFNNRMEADVLSVSKQKDVFLHRIRVTKGSLQLNDPVEARIDVVKRNRTARNHTGTHLLHKALKQVVGNHVEQAGSYVTSTGLRFDFSHFEPVSSEQLSRIESIVNEKIDEFLPVLTREMPLEEAVKTGAAAQFGEKYGKTVRVVSSGDFSHELCGGTHVQNTGQIGSMHILSESGVAAGVRRIEAITGGGLNQRLQESENLVNAASAALKTSPDNLLLRIDQVSSEWKAQKRELEQQKSKDLSGSIDDIISRGKEINGVKLITGEFTGYEPGDLRLLSDKIRDQLKNGVIVLAAKNDDKVNFIVSVTDDLLDKGYHAGNLIKPIAAAAGGGGGGKADMAQAGGKDPSKIPQAFAVAETLL